jgi:transcriptional regulator of heat shock response
VDSFVRFIDEKVFLKENKMKLEKTYKLRAVSQSGDDIQDLIDDCLNFLHSLTLSQKIVEKIAAAEQKLREIESISNSDMKYKLAKAVLFQDIFEILESIAPEGCYFGSHPGDATVMGFWDKSLFSATR